MLSRLAINIIRLSEKVAVIRSIREFQILYFLRISRARKLSFAIKFFFSRGRAIYYTMFLI